METAKPEGQPFMHRAIRIPTVTDTMVAIQVGSMEVAVEVSMAAEAVIDGRLLSRR